MLDSSRISASVAFLLCATFLACTSKDESGDAGANGGSAGATAGASAGRGAAGLDGGEAGASGSGAGGGSGAVAGGHGGASGSSVDASLDGAGATDLRDAAMDGSSSSGCSVDVWVVLDASGSMSEDDGSGTRWELTTAALLAWAEDTTAHRLGLVWFPHGPPGVTATCCSDSDCGDYGPCQGGVPNLCTIIPTGLFMCEGAVCAPEAYDEPAIALTTMANARAALATLASETMPNGQSPLRGAITRTLTHARASAAAAPSHKTLLIVLVDGPPNICGDDAAYADLAPIFTGVPDAEVETHLFHLGPEPAELDALEAAGVHTRELRFAIDAGTGGADLVEALHGAVEGVCANP